MESLPGSQETRVLEILEEYLAEVERGRRPNAEELIARHPDLAERLRAYLGSLEFLDGAAGGSDGDGLGGASERSLVKKRLGDFAIVGEIGRGGMGVVYEARQISLDRRVALKVLPFAALFDQRQIARFANEARAAAQLHHANIVPIFAVGCERGVHYYAMQYIEGQPLSHAVSQLRHTAETEAACGTAKDGRALVATTRCDRAEPTGGNRLSTARSVKEKNYLRNVAALGVDVAEALQHAHDYGIVHRDIKPSNLLLDGAGKVWITDFGLARFQTGDGLTASGDILGTLYYMSPEQADGKTHLIDGRTDIYSLGVTLYELLTLHNAFTGDRRGEVLRRIIEEDPPAPRKLNPAVPVDLETIVLKAVSKSPADRYATAQELADDLRRFLEGRPTLARRPTLADRIGKWAGRHRATVVSAVIVMAVALVGSLAATLLIAGAHGRTKEALAQSDVNQKRAQENFRQLRGLLDHFGTRYVQGLAGLPGTELLRHEILEDTRCYYRDFIRQAGDDPTLKADLAVAYSKIGAITAEIGDQAEALLAHEKARRILEELTDTGPDADAHRADLALCWNNIGLLHSQAGQTMEARVALEKAIAIQSGLSRANPDVSRFRRELALSHGNLGLLQSQVNEAAEAETSYLSAIRIQEEMVRSRPDDPDCMSELATSYNNLSCLHGSTDPSRAAKWCRKALKMHGKLAEAHPDVPKYHGDLALAHNNLGAIERQRGRLEEAKASYLEAIRIQERLVRKAPAVIQFRADLAVSRNNLGRVLCDLGAYNGAIEAFRAACAALECLVADYPGQLNYHSGLGGTLNNLGMVFERLVRLDSAADAYDRAIQHQLVALEGAPHVADFRRFLSKHYSNHSRVLRTTGHWREAAEAVLARKALWPDERQRLYRVAVELALLAEEVHENGTSAADGADADRLAEAAIVTLREAFEAGFDPPENWHEATCFDRLRNHQRFNKMLAGSKASGGE